MKTYCAPFARKKSAQPNTCFSVARMLASNVKKQRLGRSGRTFQLVSRRMGYRNSVPSAPTYYRGSIGR
eukprot:3722153-Amphidinium_carterae.1